MSVWADIHRRANGLQEKKEDKIMQQEDDLEFLMKKISVSAASPMDVFRAYYTIDPINEIK